MEHLSPCSPNSDNPDVLAEVGTLDLKSRKKNRSGTSKNELGRLSLQRLLLGTLSTANLSRAPHKLGLRLAATRFRLQERKDH